MSPPQSLLRVLQRQHAHIASLTSRVMESVGRERQGAVTDLLQYVALHESAEQTFMHPVAIRSVGDMSAVQGRVAEEREIEAVITHLEGLNPDSVDFMIYFGLLEEALSGHTRAEEEVEAPVLGAVVPDQEIEHMARGLELVDVWMDPATRSIDGSMARLPLLPGPAGQVGFGELQRRSLEAFDAVFRLR
ncbi:hemerythrin domain-containing protein [Intrasporangium sp. DVR]|uniref:hemerythrin domain-containing protein n=1 Tax=Intrasporangium sp. DVR TaxID=3127867 RepID=UPI00313A6EDD